MKNPDCKYDALVGMSGGRDRTFTAHYAVRELGLKVMGFTYDNGFMPKTTWENIYNAVKILGIEHTIVAATDLAHTVKSVLEGVSRKPSLAMVAFLCSGCQTGIFQNLARVADELDCPVVITGGGEPEQSFAEYLLSGSSKRDKKSLLKGFWRELKANPYYFNPAILYGFSKEFLSRFINRPKNITFVELFRYVEWDETEIVQLITCDLNWRIPEKMSTSWRSDCNIHVIRQFFYFNVSSG